MNPSIRSYLAELIGTFTLVFVGTAVATLQGYLNILPDNPVGYLVIALAFGGTLAVLVIVIGPVSGCHINPAVSLSLAIAGRLKWARLPGYVIAQCIGAIVASGILLLLMKGFADFDVLTHGVGGNVNAKDMAVLSLFGWEVVLTALFVMTILAATRDNVAPVSCALAIGGFLFLAHLIGVPLGDSSLNPARSLGPALAQGGDALQILWLFILGPLVGGIFGVVFYRIIYEK
jgi:aquaporin Z